MSNKKLFFHILTFIFILIVFSLISAFWGSYDISIFNSETIKAAFSDITKFQKSPAYIILFDIRIPRILLAIIIGSSLSLSGLNFQSVLRNPLADPYLLGVSSGSAFGVVVFIFLGLSQVFFFGITFFAFLGGIISILIVFYFIPWLLLRNRISLSSDIFILSGVILSFLFGSLIIFFIAYSDHSNLQRVIYWLMGSLALADYRKVVSSFPYFILIFPFFIYYSKALNLIQIGDESAISLGVNPFKVKKRVLLLSSILTSSVVAVSGTIGFVGLIIPHFVKLVFGFDNRVNVFITPIWGAIFMVLADFLSRLLSSNIEIPVGAVTTILGAPIFIFILTRRNLGR